ncbi:MAG: hypothetical protein CMB75_02360 [Euryarchaeota archaeon]|nr:hypothetical protein [Euryarchaeota archaeon]
MAETPKGVPEHLWSSIVELLDTDIAPFLPYLPGRLEVLYEDPGDGRMGITRFKMDHNELERRRKFRMGPGEVVILLHPELVDDPALRDHTLVHELLHASGLLTHDSLHADLASKIAPAPTLKNSVVLQRMRQRVLESLPERTWLCGNCGHAWERRRVTRPTRCPKCAKPFSPAPK